MQGFLDHEFLGNSTLRWTIAIVTALAVLAVLVVIKRVVAVRLAKLTQRTTSRYDDVLVKVVQGTRTITLFVAAIAAGARTLALPDEADLWLGRALIVVLAIQAGLWVTHAVKLVIEGRTAKADEMPGARTMGAAAAFLTNLVVWSVMILVVLSNFGVEITTLIAGLGIGGIAAALAVQNMLKDLFAAFSIYADRPFDIGDFIIVDDFLGNVDRIGWRTTHLRSIGGEMIVFSNSDLASARIRNYKRMSERRIVVPFGVEYGTPAAKLASIPTIVREAVEGVDGLRFDRSHFKGYGDSSLDFETVFYVLSPDYAFYMERQQTFLMAIYRRFEQDGISFAFPTRTLHVHRHGDPDAQDQELAS
ncbi:MAG: mechanosensitive ion channel family protein [Myxococcota bacterium]|nr:mechanosensitive ion channel family protein [Myxococcota bacterium]